MKKNRIYWVVFFLVFSIKIVSSQNIEHLEKQIDQVETWEEKLDLYLEIADTLMWFGQDLGKSKKYAELALKSCETNNCGDKKALARAILAEFGINEGDYTIIKDVIFPSLKLNDFQKTTTRAHFQEMAGGYFIINGNGESALEYYSKAQNILEKDAPRSKRLINVYMYMAYAHNLNSKNDSSIIFMKKCVEQARLTQDTIKLVSAMTGLNTLYGSDGQYSKGIEVLLETKKLVENSDIVKNQIFLIYDALIHLYITNKDYVKAEKELKKIIPKYRATNEDMNSKAITMWSYYLSYSRLKGRVNRYEEAMEYIDSAYVYVAYLNDFSKLVTDLRRTGINLNLKNYELAYMQIQDLIDKTKKLGQVDAFNAALIGLLADVYLGSSLQPSKAIEKEFLPTIERIIEKNEGQYNLDLLDAQQLSTVFAIYNNQKEKAIQGLHSILSIQDTLQSREKEKSIDEILVKYETDKKDKQLAINELELSRQKTLRYSLIGSILALMIIVTVLILFFQQKNKYAKELEKEVADRTVDLQKSNQALIMSNEELERYTYIASHDLKEPLRNVVSFVGMLKRKNLIEKGQAQTYFEYIETGANQMNDIVKGVLEFSEVRKMDVMKQQVSISQVIDNVKFTLQNEINAKRAVIETYDLPKTILTDESMVFTIFKNLIENALKFNDSTMPFIKIDYKMMQNNHVFKVVDNGIGIDKIYHDQIFGMFKRLHERGKYNGSGIGLAICKRTLGYLNGEISVESNIETGVTFTIKFPKIDG